MVRFWTNSFTYLSDIAVAAPNAQQDPQPAWSQIMLIDWHLGHCLRGSNSVGSSSKPKQIRKKDYKWSSDSVDSISVLTTVLIYVVSFEMFQS